MTKYIPAVKEEGGYPRETTYEIAWRTVAFDSYQEALNEATKEALGRNERGAAYSSQYIPVVLKEVKMVEEDKQ